jgi:hypothetical protein
MRNTRRPRKLDPLANLFAVRSVCSELQTRCPDTIPKTDKKLFSLLAAVKHINQYPSTQSLAGRPSAWKREDLLIVSNHLKSILQQRTKGRVSLSSFIGIYLRVLNLSNDILKVLEEGKITLQEAITLSRLTPEKLSVSHQKAFAIRKEVMDAHIKTQASQNSLRAKIKEILGETNIISSQTLIANVAMVDRMLELDPTDKRHLFYEQIKNLVFAIRQIQPEDIDDELLADFNITSDELFRVINSAKKRHRQKTSSPISFHL